MVGRLHHHLSGADLLAGQDDDRAKGTVVLEAPFHRELSCGGQPRTGRTKKGWRDVVAN